MRVLLTGHGGFIGHHCLEYFLDKTDWSMLCIDSYRHKGTIRRVVEAISDNTRVTTFKHDLSVPIDLQLENLMLEKRLDPNWFAVNSTPIDIIINMASDSAVERSTQNPTYCLRNNYDLMINMLEFARKCEGLKLFIHISTDEVYGEAGLHGHKEWDTILPSNPYAASKAAQEALAIAYWRTYGVPVVIVNIMNVIGERQDKEKFLPKIIEKVYKGEQMPIHAERGGSIGSRVYLHAKNVADALIFLSKKEPAMYNPHPQPMALPPWGNGTEPQQNYYEIQKPDRYNICGDTEVNNLEMALLVADIMGKELNYQLVQSHSARPGYDRRYMLDGTKLREAGWTAPMGFRESLRQVIDWTVKHPHWAAL